VHEREAARFVSLFASELDPSLQTWLGGFGRAVVFAAAPDEVLLRNLAAAIPQVHAVTTRPPQGRFQLVGRWQVEQLECLGLAGASRPLIPLVQPPSESTGAFLAPGSGGKAKRLTPDMTAYLARRLEPEHRSLTLVLGPAEDAAYREAQAQALQGLPHRILADAPMAELASNLLGSSLYVGADSGVSHLAAALGAPCLAVFQASDPRLWSPLGPRARVLGVTEARFADLSPPAPGAVLNL